jgi:hypothetical protein
MSEPGKIQKSGDGLASSPAPENLKFQREDWTAFRTVEGLQQKAGVALDKLTRLVMKELADNGLDNSAEAEVGELPNGHGYYVEDEGSGIDGTPEQIAELFSIARPMVSTKLLRLPTRGALGNGLRVVAGSVLASGGSLVVITRNRRIVLRQERDGTTTVVSAKTVNRPVGTRVEISFGPALPCDVDVLFWAEEACQLSEPGSVYAGKSSPHWYDAATFHEVLDASGNRPVRELVAQLDGCSGGKAGEIVAEARLGRALCKDVTRPQAEKLLAAARDNAKPVTPERLGAVGADAFRGYAYARSCGVARFGAAEPQAEIPFVVEAWVRETGGETELTVCVNRTPITGEIEPARDKRKIDAFGCGLAHTIAEAPKDAEFDIWINVTTPYMPITSDGKEPNLHPFLGWICVAVEKAVKKARRPNATSKQTQKDVVLDNLDAAIADASGGGEFRFTVRQVFYVLRPIVMSEMEAELKIGNFTTIITDYESEHGEIPGMYREPRGSIYHPHRGETITLGTLMVEDYERPEWTFSAALYIEKEGFGEALKEARWAERHDCMLMSSKGFSSRAARDLVDKLAEHDEPVVIFCVHDADAAGTLIHQTFQEATKARGARKIRIVNLGLEPWEAVAMGLEAEDVAAGDRRKPVADYVLDREDVAPNGEPWDEWLQTHRIELNALTTPQFIAWLDRKLAGYSKLVPPADVLAAELEERIEEKLRANITERILREARIDAQVAEAIAAIEKPTPAALAEGIRELFESEPDREWRDHIEAIVKLKTEDDLLTRHRDF